MDKKFFIETEHFANNNAELNLLNSIQITNDNLVNDFLKKNVSLESLIENEIYKTNYKNAIQMVFFIYCHSSP